MNNYNSFLDMQISIIAQCNQRRNLGSFLKKLKLNMDVALKLIKSVKKILEKEDSILKIKTHISKNVEFVVAGDIHGNLESLIRIFQEKGYPPQTRYLFLGDYIDRGNNSIEVLLLLFILKVFYKDDIFLLRGNHEFKDMANNYGFENECLSRICQKDARSGKLFYQSITEVFPLLPIAAILNNSIFCVHGGITALIENREELLKIEKVGDCLTYNNSVQAELLWNDPSIDVSLYKKSPRGIGCLFGEEALEYFLRKMEFTFVIRGHQDEMDGYNFNFEENGGILTVFSSFDYCGTLNNGAVAIINKIDDENKKLISIHSLDVLPESTYEKVKFILPAQIFEKINGNISMDCEIPSFIDV